MWEVKLKVVSVCTYISLLVGAILWHLVNYKIFTWQTTYQVPLEVPFLWLHCLTLFNNHIVVQVAKAMYSFI